MLETNLDALIEPDTSFLVPRDAGLLLNNCLWNGFMGSEPGHPVLARMIEHVLRNVLEGNADGSTVERYILHGTPFRDSTEIWKLRAVASPDQYVYGGCALGVAVNQVLSKGSPVDDFDLGKQSMPDGGNLLILMVR
jgi:hypothetical protein